MNNWVESKVSGLKRFKITMAVDQSSYRQIIRATSVLGGIQVFNIIISIIRSKFIAVLLGPAGMGIAGLLVTTTGLIEIITGFGLSTSAVRNISVASAQNDSLKLRTTVTIFRKLVWFTGLLGTIVTIIFAPLLSELTFGNRNYTLAFSVISITLLLSQLSTGQLVILQGTRNLKYLAKADMVGFLIGLFISVPLYYKFGTDGIIPAILASSSLALLSSWFFSSKVKIPKVTVSKSHFRFESKSMLKMGFLLSLSGLITAISSYALKIFIGKNGGVEQVGFYNAGFAIINTYVGIIFTAMVKDYYPRLSEVSSDNRATVNLINIQSEIAILIIAPILMMFITFINWAVILLYSVKFSAIIGMLRWAALGMFFKTVCWTLSFVFMAKGSARIFFLNELIFNIYLLILNIIGYKLYGLTGLGISFLIGYIVFFLHIFIQSRLLYTFTFNKDFIKFFIIQFLIGLISFFTIEKVGKPFSYLLTSTFILLSCIYSFIELNKRLNISQFLLAFFNKIRKRNALQ